MNKLFTKKNAKLFLSAFFLVAILFLIVTFLTREKTSETYSSAQSVPVPISISNAPSTIHIGIVETLGEHNVEGTGWASNAQGAVVAAHRLGLSGIKVTFEVVNDYGTPSGAQEAIARLAQAKVSGIIAATSGEHCRYLAQAAAKEEIPIIFPYEARSIPDSPGVWTMAVEPTNTVWIKDALSSRNATQPLLITTSNFRDIGGINSAAILEFTSENNTDTFLTQLRDVTQKQAIDSIIILGDAYTSALTVGHIQEAGLNLPIIVTPQAYNSLFSSTLLEHGTLNADITSYGVTDSDITALQPDNAGARASAFFAALRALTYDKQAQNIEGDTPFADVATFADTASHDSLLAFVYGASYAHTTNGKDIREALIKHGELTSADLLAGPHLDFTNHTLIASAHLSSTHSTNDTTGLRTKPGERLYFFSHGEGQE